MLILETLLKLPFAFAAGVFLSVVSVVNPPSTVPIFLGLSNGMDERARARLALRASAYCFYILLASLFVGGIVMHFFGVSYGALRVAGGIVVGRLGYGLMYDKGPHHSPYRRNPAHGDVAFFPLAMPGITGPGTIAVVIGISTECRGVAGWSGELMAYTASIAAMACVGLAEWLLLRNAIRVRDRLGPLGLEVMTRLSGFLMICVGVQFIATGIRTLVLEH
ncbi:MAG: MarC family NAAT transporter [Xanthomonadaceae bacterium]|nr:MarC family NAAT transporter [Xanthomonadaceae bacterium]